MTIDADTFAFSDISVPVAKVRGDLRYMRSTPSDRAFLKRDASVSENVPYFFFYFFLVSFRNVRCFRNVIVSLR